MKRTAFLACALMVACASLAHAGPPAASAGPTFDSPSFATPAADAVGTASAFASADMFDIAMTGAELAAGVRDFTASSSMPTAPLLAAEPVVRVDVLASADHLTVTTISTNSWPRDVNRVQVLQRGMQATATNGLCTNFNKNVLYAPPLYEAAPPLMKRAAKSMARHSRGIDRWDRWRT